MYFYHTTGTYARDSYPVLRMYCVDKREILQWGYYKKNERFHVLNDWEDAIGGLILTFMYESLERPKAAFEEVAEFLSEIPTKPPEESTWAAWGGHLSVVSRMHPFFHLGELLFSNIYQRHQNGEPIDPNEFIELSNGYQHLQDYLQDLASGCFNAEHTDENCLKRYIEQFSKQKTLFSKLVFCPEVVPAVYSRDFRFDPPKASDFVTSPVWKRYPCILEQVFYPTSPKELEDYLTYVFLQNDITFKICKNCNRYFPVIGKSKREYCTRPIDDSWNSRCCLDVGASRLYNSTRSKNPAMKAYMKAYKTRNSRMRAKHLTKEEFTQWSAAARKERDNCIAGRITLDQFQNWLDTH